MLDSDPVPTGCVLFVLQASPSMQEEVSSASRRSGLPTDPPVSKWEAACHFIQSALVELSQLSQHGNLGELDLSVGVLGYRADPSGELKSASFLGASPEEAIWNSPEDWLPVYFDRLDATKDTHVPVCENPDLLPEEDQGDPVEEGSLEPEETAVPPGASAGEALRLAHGHVRKWLENQGRAVCAFVIHCMEGNDLDTRHAQMCRSIGCVQTTLEHSVQFWNCIFTSKASDPAELPCVQSASPRHDWQTLWAQCNSYGSLKGGASSSKKRALSVNDCPASVFADVIQMIADRIREAPQPGKKRFGEESSCEVHPLRTPKRGNTEEEWEDGYDIGPEEGIVVIADGAGEGIFSRQWAATLAEACRKNSSVIYQPRVPLKWLQHCREGWREAISQSRELRWSQLNKVNEVGSGSTLLGLKLEKKPPSPRVRWTAWSIGDCCLFWIRDNQLHASFPFVSAKSFGGAPPLLRTLPKYTPPVPLRAHDHCLAGDAFVLATDAVAQYLLSCCERGEQPDWERYSTMSNEEWKAEIEQLRDQQRIENDDSTLLFVRVGDPAAPGKQLSEQTSANDEEASSQAPLGLSTGVDNG